MFPTEKTRINIKPLPVSQVQTGLTCYWLSFCVAGISADFLITSWIFELFEDVDVLTGREPMFCDVKKMNCR